MIIEGNPAKPRSVNVRGLTRRGVEEPARDALRRAFREIFHGEHNVTDACDQLLAVEKDPSPQLLYLIDFMRRIDQGTRGRQKNP